jgi:hypothetical protein
MGKKKTEFLSFVGGLLFFSVIVGIVVVRNESIRNEIESQARGFLGISRNILQQLQSGFAKAKAIAGASKIAKQNSKLNEQEDGSSPDTHKDGYDALWQSVETQHKVFVKNHLPR